MAYIYDMCVDEDTIIELKRQLTNVNNKLNYASQEMIVNLSRAKGFLDGNQFLKAESITSENYNKSLIMSNEICDAIDYLSEIENILQEYFNCEYEG